MATEPTVINKQETVEVINADGQSAPHNENLSKIFDMIEGGKAADAAVKEVMTSQDEPTTKERPLFDEPAAVKPDDKPDEKPAVKPDEVVPDKTTQKPAEKPITGDDEEVTEEELTVQPHDKPKTAKRIRALLTKIDTANSVHAITQKDLDSKAARLAELETELKKVKSESPQITDEIKQQLADLKMYRRLYELDKDPEVKAKFDNRVDQSEASIQQMLQRRGAGEALLNIIKEEGGWAKFTESSRVIRVNEASGARDVPASELAESIMDTLSYKERRDIDAAVIEQSSARRERQRFVEEESKNAEAYFQKKQQADQQTNDAIKLQVAEAQKAVDAWQQKITAEDFMKERPIPADAKPEEKAAIEEDNKYTKQMHSIAKQYLNVKTLPEMLGVVEDAVRYHQERREAARLQARIKVLEAKAQEFERYKAAGKVTPKQGSIAGGGTPEPDQKPAPKARTLEDAFNLLESGEKLDQAE